MTLNFFDHNVVLVCRQQIKLTEVCHRYTDFISSWQVFLTSWSVSKFKAPRRKGTICEIAVTEETPHSPPNCSDHTRVIEGGGEKSAWWFPKSKQTKYVRSR